MNSRKCCYTIFSKNGNKNKINFKLKLSDGEIPYNLKPVFPGIIFMNIYVLMNIIKC